MGNIDPKIIEFVTNNVNWLRQKKVILLCSCLVQNRAEQYLMPIKNILGQSVVFQSSIVNDFKLFDKNKFAKLALSIKEIKDMGNKIIEEQELKSYIKDFIKNHNTCTLATGHDESVRATPIEYIFIDECIYILSEGGEKFSNILLNPNVSIAIYDTFKNMNELSGMQIKGAAEIIDIGSDEYISVLTHKNLKYDNIIELPIALNLIKINIRKIEFLWSGFAKLGYDTKQILY